MIKVLMNNQRRILINTVKSQGIKNYLSYLVIFVVLAGLLFFLSRGIWTIAGSISEPVLEGMLSYGLLMIIGFIILLGLPQIFKHLYSATDLELLFTLPIPTRHIFIMKYLQSFFGVPLFAVVFFLVLLTSFGISSGASLLYYPVLICVLLAAAIVGLSITYLFNLILIQIVPASKANEFMTVMSVLSGLFVYLLFMMPNMTNDKTLTEILQSGLPLFPDWVPVSWGSAALINAANGSPGFLLPFVLLLILAIFSVILTSVFVEKGFRTGWIQLSEGGGKKKKRTAKRGKSHAVHHPIIAIGKKDWLAIKRDIREWLVFLPLGFFIVFPMIGFFSGGGNLSDLRGFNEISWPITQGVLLFIYAIFNGQLSASSISREGTSVWILRTLPLSGKNIALGKLWISWLLPFILLTFIESIVGVFLGWTLLQFSIGILVKAGITLGVSAIGLWLGTIGAKYNPTNPQQRLKFGTSIVLLVLSYAYLFLILIPYGLLLIPGDAAEFAVEASNDIPGFFGVIFNIFTMLLLWKASHPVLILGVGLAFLLTFSLGIAALFIYISSKRIDKGIEIDIVSETKNSKAVFKRKAGGSLY